MGWVGVVDEVEGVAGGQVAKLGGAGGARVLGHGSLLRRVLGALHDGWRLESCSTWGPDGCSGRVQFDGGPPLEWRSGRCRMPKADCRRTGSCGGSSQGEPLDAVVGRVAWWLVSFSGIGPGSDRAWGLTLAQATCGRR